MREKPRAVVLSRAVRWTVWLLILLAVLLVLYVSSVGPALDLWERRQITSAALVSGWGRALLLTNGPALRWYASWWVEPATWAEIERSILP